MLEVQTEYLEATLGLVKCLEISKELIRECVTCLVVVAACHSCIIIWCQWWTRAVMYAKIHYSPPKGVHLHPPYPPWICHWTPYINMIEGLQKFAARLATKQWNTSYNDLLAQLGWPLLSTRRKQQKQFLCHRILSGYSILPPSIFIPHPSTLRHSYHLPLYRPVTRSTAYSASFFPSVIPLWNNLPLDTVLATSLSGFKSQIKLNSSLIL